MRYRKKSGNLHEGKVISMIDARRALDWKSNGFERGKRVYVYAIHGGDKIKIGVAVNVKRRLIGMQTGSPAILIVLDRIRCYSRDEAEMVECMMHRELSSLHSHGEWFSGPTLVMEKFKEAKRIISESKRNRVTVS